MQDFPHYKTYVVEGKNLIWLYLKTLVIGFIGWWIAAMMLMEMKLFNWFTILLMTGALLYLIKSKVYQMLFDKEQQRIATVDYEQKRRSNQADRNAKTRKACSEIQTFNIQDIGRPYKAITGIESKNQDKELAKGELCQQAIKLGADAIINMKVNTESIVQGNVTTSKDMFSGDVSVHGKTDTVVIYHYIGTAVKLEG